MTNNDLKRVILYPSLRLNPVLCLIPLISSSMLPSPDLCIMLYLNGFFEFHVYLVKFVCLLG